MGKKLKLIFFIIILFLFYNISFSYYIYNENEIQTTLENNNIEIIPTKYDNYSNCNTDLEKYNQKYSEYSRSSCFYYNEYFRYFICTWDQTCILENLIDSNNTVEIEETQNSNTITSTSDNNDSVEADELILSESEENEKSIELSKSTIEKLDEILLKIQKKWEEYNDIDKYKVLLDAVSEKFSQMTEKYSENKSVLLKIQYLQEWIEKLIDNLNVIQWLYRATENTYTVEELKNDDVCKTEFWWDWILDKSTSADSKIMLASRLWIDVWNNINSTKCNIYNSDLNLKTVSCESKYKASCILDPINEIVDDKYRLTKNTYMWKVLYEWDICKTEFWNDWKLIKEDNEWITKLIQTYPKTNVWLTSSNYFKGISNNNNFYWYKRLWWEYVINNDYLNKYNINWGFSYNTSSIYNENIKYRFACKKDENSYEDSTKIVQDLYRATAKKYTFTEFINSKDDLCKVDFWYWRKTSTWSVDSNIMIESKNNIWTWIYSNTSTCWYYEWGEIEKDCNRKLSIACEIDYKSLKNENYEDYLVETDEEWIEDFYNSVEKEVKSKIKEDKNYIYFNNKYALTKTFYYWNQIYTQRECEDWWIDCLNWYEVSWVCPTWYKIEENNSLYYNTYEQEIIWYYLAKNRNNYDFEKDSYNTDWYFTSMWSWYNLDQYFVRKKTLDEIKEVSQKQSFKTSVIKIANPYTNWGPNWKSSVNIDEYTRKNTYFARDQYWSSWIIWTKRPVLCVTKNTELINSWTNKNNIKPEPISEHINMSDEYININNTRAEWINMFFYSYHKAKVLWLLSTESNRVAFSSAKIYLPVYQKIINWNYYYIFYKKFFK